MDIIVFQEQKNYFLLNMSRIVKAVVTIEKKLGVEQYQAVVFGRRRRSTYAKRYKRDSEDSRGTQVNLKVDNRKCESNCFSSTGQVANYLAALKTKNEKLPGDPYKIEAESPPAGGGPSPPIQPLYIAIICVSLPLIAVGVLVGGKRVFAKLWLPEGFPSRSIKRHSQRHDPVGEDSDDKGSIGKTSTCEEEYPDQPTHSGRSRKRLKLVVDDGPLRIANPKDNRQWTALHREVADVNNRTISSLSVLTPPQEGQECSAAQSDVNAIGPGGMTPLMLAVSRGTYLDGGPLEDDKDSDDNGGQVVGELIQFGARIESISDESKETALHLAARHARADAAKRLLDAGADSNAKDRTGRTPLHLAVTADAQGVFQLLIRHRATLLDEPSDDGTTPLIYAARFMVDEMVEDLIKAGAKVNLTDKQGKTALHWAASVDNEKATALLLRNNAKRDAQDAKGQTPLFLASKEGSASVVKLLLSSFANRKLADNMDQSPLDIAKQRDHADIVKLLSDWSLGCKSPTAAPAPTSPAGEMSPLAARTLSPPDVRPKTNRSPRTQLSTETQQKQSRKKRRKSRPENEGPIAVALVSRNSPPSVAGVNGTSPRQGLSPFNSSNSYGSSLSPSNSTFSPPLHHIDGMPSPLRDSDLVNGIPDTGFYPMTEEMACYQNSLNPDAEFMNVENAVDLNELSMLFGASSEQQNNKDCMYGGQYPPDNMILPNGVENEVQVRLRYGTDRRAHGMPAKTCVRSPSQLTAWNSLCSNVVPSVATIDGIHRRRARNQDCQYPSPPYELSPTSPHENQWSSSSSSRASNSDCSTC